MTGTERKVFQKYYPPDYDPSKLPKAKGVKNRQFVQRVMAPYNMQCNTCHEYIYKGKKFNMRRETAEGENYLGLRLFRFYFRCPNCLAEISFKTDLENCDYQQEHGATRLFDAFKHYQEQAKKDEAEEEAEKADAMKMLEKRTKMSKKEMQAVGELEEIQELNRRNEGIDARDFVLDDKQKALFIAEKQRIEAEKDEELIRQMFFKTRADGHIIRRIEDDEDELSQEGSLGILGKRKMDEKKMMENI
uniref:Splicing factor YJU2 n=1 Tax=Panagrolaimus superbus TaxID=310955 RepID=A0A914YPJ7_9BILA